MGNPGAVRGRGGRLQVLKESVLRSSGHSNKDLGERWKGVLWTINKSRPGNNRCKGLRCILGPTRRPGWLQWRRGKQQASNSEK